MHCTAFSIQQGVFCKLLHTIQHTTNDENRKGFVCFLLLNSFQKIDWRFNFGLFVFKRKWRIKNRAFTAGCFPNVENEIFGDGLSNLTTSLNGDFAFSIKS